MIFTRRLSMSALLAVLVPSGPQIARADDANLLQALRGGGNVILLRHSATIANQTDTDPLNFENVAAQRQLNEQGKTAVQNFGGSLREAAIPVGNVYTSKYHRAYETAALAGLQSIVTTLDVTDGGSLVAAEENKRRAAALKRMLTTAPKAGTNTIIVTHRPNILDALGNDWRDVKEGEASIFRVENRAYRLVVRVQTDDWPRLVAAK